MIRTAGIALVAGVRHRVELRRHLAHPQLGVAVLVGVAFGTLFVVGSLPLPYLESLWTEPGAYHYGTVVAEREGAVLELSRSVSAIAVVAFAALAALRSTTRDAWESPPVEVVTAVPLPTAILGVFGDELAESSWFVAPIAISGALAFSAGTGSPETAAGAVGGGVAVVVTGLTLGSASGLGFRAAIRDSPRLYRARFGLGFVGLFVTFFALTVTRTAGDALARTPLGWFGDLLLLTAPGATVSRPAALGALVVTAGAVALSLAIVFPAARTLWFGDHGAGRERSSPRRDGRTTTAFRRLETALERWTSRPTAAVAGATWRRVRRSPRVLVFVVLPFAVVGPATADAASRWPELVPALLALYAAVAVGMGTTLNVLGNERVALATILTTPGGRRAVLRGHALAALVPGAPLAVVAGLAGGAAIGFVPGELLAIGIVALALAVGGVGVSLGIGAFFPNLEGPSASTATLSPPELYATVVYMLATSALAGPAFVGFAASRFGLPRAGLTVGVALTVLVATLAGGLGYSYAARALESLEERA